MKNKIIALGICALILFAVFISGCTDDEKEDKEEEEEENGNGEVPTAIFELEHRDELNSTLGQNLTMVYHKSGDSVKWSDLRIQISNDGVTFYLMKFNEESPINVIMTKGVNIGDEILFEVGESIFFKEGSKNWNALNDFYIILVHTPSHSTIYDDHIDLV